MQVPGGDSGRVLGGLAGHVAHIVEFTAGSQFAFNGVMKAYPGDFLLRQSLHDPREREADQRSEPVGVRGLDD